MVRMDQYLTSMPILSFTSMSSLALPPVSHLHHCSHPLSNLMSVTDIPVFAPKSRQELKAGVEACTQYSKVCGCSRIRSSKCIRTSGHTDWLQTTFWTSRAGQKKRKRICKAGPKELFVSAIYDSTVMMTNIRNKTYLRSKSKTKLRICARQPVTSEMRMRRLGRLQHIMYRRAVIADFDLTLTSFAHHGSVHWR